MNWLPRVRAVSASIPKPVQYEIPAPLPRQCQITLATVIVIVGLHVSYAPYALEELGRFINDGS